jgi:DNA polymerase-3 subunit beta
MNIRLNRIELLNELVPMMGVVERNAVQQVLTGVLLRAHGGRLHISATDLEVSLTSSCDAEVLEEGAIVISAKKLVEIVRASAGDEVSLEVVKDGTLNIAAGKSRFKLRGLPAEDFPTLPKLESEEPIDLDFPTFRAMIGKVFYAISAEESRFQLSGALLKIQDGGVALVATDGHRMALVESEVEGPVAEPGILVPRKALQELQRFENMEDLHFRHSEHHLSFTVGRRQLICRVLEGAFPADYERVVVKDNDKVVKVDRKALSDVLRRVGLLTSDRSRVVKLELEPGRLIFSAANPDLGEAVEEMPCDYAGPGAVVGVNPDYLGQILATCETSLVRLELKDKNSPCVVYPESGRDKRHVCVVMPIRL